MAAFDLVAPISRSMRGQDASMGIVTCSLDDMEGVVRALRRDVRPNGGVIAIRGQRCVDYRECMHELGAALQFPWYFGHNWDAASECLADLDWLLYPEVWIVLTEADRAIESSDDEFRILIAMCQTAAREVADDALPDSARSDTLRALRFILHCTEDRLPVLLARLSRAGIAAPVLYPPGDRETSARVDRATE